jgi:rapamycin-insensitive companion of mTOR
MKERITAQLEAAANRIRNLESQLERLRGGTFYSPCSRELCSKLATPLRSRMRPQARLHGFSSNSSLSIGQMSTSHSSSTLLSAGRPHMSRQASRLTPDRERPDIFPAQIPLPTTPSRAGSNTLMPGSSQSRRPRSVSIGADSLGSPRQGDTTGSSRMGWMPSTSPGEAGQEAHNAGLIENAVATIARLRSLGARATGKGKVADRGDEAWQCMTKLAGMLKQTPSMRVLLSAEEIVDGFVAIWKSPKPIG